MLNLRHSIDNHMLKRRATAGLIIVAVAIAMVIVLYADIFKSAKSAAHLTWRQQELRELGLAYAGCTEYADMALIQGGQSVQGVRVKYNATVGDLQIEFLDKERLRLRRNESASELWSDGKTVQSAEQWAKTLAERYDEFLPVVPILLLEGTSPALVHHFRITGPPETALINGERSTKLSGTWIVNGVDLSIWISDSTSRVLKVAYGSMQYTPKVGVFQAG
jgi:hypothetical protein